MVNMFFIFAKLHIRYLFNQVVTFKMVWGMLQECLLLSWRRAFPLYGEFLPWWIHLGCPAHILLLMPQLQASLPWGEGGGWKWERIEEVTSQWIEHGKRKVEEHRRPSQSSWSQPWKGCMWMRVPELGLVPSWWDWAVLWLTGWALAFFSVAQSYPQTLYFPATSWFGRLQIACLWELGWRARRGEYTLDVNTRLLSLHRKWLHLSLSLAVSWGS